jgi:2-phosphosulfolactate phosphatase
MKIDVVLLPSLLDRTGLEEKTVVVFDVLRATTSITAALAVGVKSIHAFASIAEAEDAAELATVRPLLSGEINTLAPPGFDLGNSPRQFNASHAGREMFLATTNGTKALSAAESAAHLLTGALVNAGAVASEIARLGLDVVLLCSGSSGNISLEDTLGAGAVIERLADLVDVELATDSAIIAGELFQQDKSDLPQILRKSLGGRNNIKVGLEGDIDFAARLDVFDVVGKADPGTLVIRAIRP